jgi:protein-L-isoaspartate(D-aspartate) O-methyltransferase
VLGDEDRVAAHWGLPAIVTGLDRGKPLGDELPRMIQDHRQRLPLRLLLPFPPTSFPPYPPIVRRRQRGYNPKVGRGCGGRIAVTEVDNELAAARARREMVHHQLRARDIRHPRVLQVMGQVPRHEFVSPERRDEAYADHPLAIGYGQTISQPYIVALMTQLADPRAGDRALDVGTGSGYQAAILGRLCKEVFGIEIVKPLADDAAKRLADLGYGNVAVRSGDGYRGWPERAPFDLIVVAASPRHLPQPLVDQLAPGGRLVIPVGGYPQDLLLIEKGTDGSHRRRNVAPVLFVPMTGEAESAANP